tara:strand:- start:155 stop:361 length:207 start_codon:yes stop_codon:yes gene_type:complete
MNQNKIDRAAIMWNRTKDPQYKELWYKYVKEFADGINNSKRRNVSSSSSNKVNDGGISFDKKSWYNLL